MRGKKASVLFVTVRLTEFIIIIIISHFFSRVFLVQPRVGWRDRGFEHEIQSSSTFVMYFIISLLHLSVLYARSFIFHMTGFLIIVGPLRWPMSDLKAIKHKTFCKTRMPLWSWRPCNASLGNYDNNSVAVGVARSLVWGWGQWDGVHQGLLSRDRSRWLVGPRHPTPFCHKLFPSCRMPSAARYRAEPLCLVATGDKARADGRVVVLAPLAVAGSAEELIMASRGKRLSQHNSIVCPLRVTNTHFCYCTLNLVLLMFVSFKRKGTRQQESCVWSGFLVSGFVAGWREGELDVAPQHLSSV